MDRETREAFDRLDGKLDAIGEELTRHRVETAEKVQKALDSTASAHHRLDECETRQKEKRGHVVTLWVGVLLALVGSALTWILGGKRP